MTSLDRSGFRGSAPAASQRIAPLSDLKNAAVLLALFVCVIGFLFLFGKSLERVSASDDPPAETVAGGRP